MFLMFWMHLVLSYNLLKHMWIEVVKVIKPFLQFLQSYDSQQVHNMFALMFDPRFEYLKVWKTMWDMGLAFVLLQNMMLMQ
jgi:hypothetical protein